MELSTTIRETQKCRIPVVDPFHREALPYITFKHNQSRCFIHNDQTQIQDGRLMIKTSFWDSIRVIWFKRKVDSDDQNDYFVTVYNITEHKHGKFIKRKLHCFIYVRMNIVKGYFGIGYTPTKEERMA